eukprot:TRINITY_DN3834_c0_g1_i4.p3 TRINITY_DN3834_c0_g1~~TRINITY_DN3834_c0_g1_i4.p3  ORF type:complete len:178 (-),score=27.07 TRINITY_DN3834_c0_g1_i4:427-960(-)
MNKINQGSEFSTPYYVGDNLRPKAGDEDGNSTNINCEDQGRISINTADAGHTEDQAASLENKENVPYRSNCSNGVLENKENVPYRSNCSNGVLENKENVPYISNCSNGVLQVLTNSQLNIIRQSRDEKTAYARKDLYGVQAKQQKKQPQKPQPKVLKKLPITTFEERQYMRKLFRRL